MATYLELLKKDKGTQEDEQFGFQAEEAKQQLDVDLLATRKALSKAKRRVKELKGAVPLSVPAIVDALDEVAAYEKGLSAMTELQAELFPSA